MHFLILFLLFILTLLLKIFGSKYFSYLTRAVDLNLKSIVLFAFSQHQNKATRYQNLISAFEYLSLLNDRDRDLDDLLGLDVADVHLQDSFFLFLFLAKHDGLMTGCDGIVIFLLGPLFFLNLSNDLFVADFDFQFADH